VPTFSEFLFAPWKTLLLLMTAAPKPGVIPAAGPTGIPPGALCGTRDMGGGQIANVCSVFGYEMPSFVFWASTLIFLLFVAASLALVFECLRVSWGLSRMCSALEKGAKDLAAVRKVMRGEALTSHLWQLFEETLLVSGEGSDCYTTQPVESAFSKTALIEENVQVGFYNTVPGILTGLGLLMTFVAILDGLSHVTVAANMDVQGIGGLINGLSGKFVSSITAVTCAVSFVFVERIAYSRPNAAYRRLLKHLSARFKRRTTEHLLHGIQSQLASQAALQKELAQALVSARQALEPAERARAK
jgi:hypothetical protein